MRRNAYNSGPVWLIRRVLGIICLAIGVLGAILPIIPGWPALFLAILLLGRRDRTLRLSHLVGRRLLRWMRTTRAPLIRSLGRRLSTDYLALRRLITPRLIAAERMLGAG